MTKADYGIYMFREDRKYSGRNKFLMKISLATFKYQLSLCFSLLLFFVLFCFRLHAAVSDVIIWDSVRTPAEITNTLENGYTSTTGMRLWWDFDSPGTNLAYDKTGNGYDGSVKGVVSGLIMTGPFGSSRTVASGFNYYNSYIVVNPNFPGNASFYSRTYELWIRNPSKNGKSVFFSITSSENGYGDALKRMWVNEDGSISIADRGYYTGINTYTSSALNWNADTWYQITVVFSYSGSDYHDVRVYRGQRPNTLSLLISYTGSSLFSTHWLAVGGHEAGYYSNSVGKAGYLGCDGNGTSPVIKPEDYGAVGDGSTDDTFSFNKACSVLSAHGQGTLQLTSGKTYKIGNETVDSAIDTQYYNAAPLGNIVGTTGNIIIDGSGSTVKLANGLHFGAFHPQTGTALPAPNYTLDPLWAANPGSLLKILACKSVEIKNVTLDGNSPNIVWGGYWSNDQSRQLEQNGICLVDNYGPVYIHDVKCKNNSLDGIEISNNDLDENSPKYEVFIEDVECIYNSRQGLSYNCGNHLEVSNSEFSHTSRISGKNNLPGAGVDVEPMGRYMAPGAVFDNCKFFDNASCGLLLVEAPACIIRGCTIWGTTYYAAMTLTSNDYDHLFVDCTIYGGYYNRGQRTRLESCSILNPATAYYSSEYPNAPTSDRIGIEQDGGSFAASGCNIQALQNAYSLWIGNAVLKNCTVTHDNYRGSGSQLIAGRLYYTYLKDVTFNETGIFASNPLDGYYICDYSGTAQIGSGVTIEGSTSGSNHYVDFSSWNLGPFVAQTIPVNISDGVLTPNAASGENQIQTNATYTASPAYTNPVDSTGDRLFDKDLPYNDWNNRCGINYVDQTVTIDLKSNRYVRAVKLQMEQTVKPKRIYVYVGDDSNWDMMGLIRPQEGAASSPWFDVTVCNPIVGRYVKIKFENDGGWGWYIDEIKVYGY